jgi:hypothetical protein
VHDTSIYGPLERQYTDLAKNPNGYCPDLGTGVSCPVGVGVQAEGATPLAMID